jgi:SAM-dependent methyltransferase
MNLVKLWAAFQNDPLLVMSFNARPRFESLLRRVRPGQALLSLAEAECTFEAMAQALPADVFSLDPSARSIEMLRRTFRMEIMAQVGYADGIPSPDASFDVVVMNEVIEHFGDTTISYTFKELQRVLRLAGRLIRTVPTNENLLDGKIVCPSCRKQAHQWGHVQSFSRDRPRGLLGGAFEVVRVSRHYFSDLSRLNWKGRFDWALKKMLIVLGAQGNQETFLFEARRC